MAQDVSAYNVIGALAKPGCAVCRLTHEAVHRHLQTLLYEGVNDVGVRARLRASHGLCADHARMAASMRDSLGLAIIYRDVLANLRDTYLDTQTAVQLPAPALLGREPAHPGRRLARRLAARQTCRACDLKHEVAAAVIEALARGLPHREMAAAYSGSDGLCTPHAREVIALTGDATALTALREKQAQVMSNLIAELSEFIRKHDYRFVAEGMGPEADSWLRAIALASGGAALDDPPAPERQQTSADTDNV